MSENAGTEPIPNSDGAYPLPSFLEDAANVWRRLPHKLLFGILFAAWIALFHYYGSATMGYAKTSSLFHWAMSVYAWREDDAHGQYIPYAVLIFLWVKRRELAEIAPKIWWPGLAYFAGAILLHIMAFRVQHARISVLAFIFGLHALIGLLWGREALKRTIFPIFLLLFCIPFGSMADVVTLDLRLLVTKISVGFSHQALGIEVFRDGSKILDGAGKAMYDVAPACSGMRSLIAMSALSVIYAFLNFDAVWRRGFLIACALPLALVANVIRITTVIVVGDAFGQATGAMIEQKFGFVTFAIALAGMIFVGWIIRERKNSPPPTNLAANPA
jgi:exosortase